MILLPVLGLAACSSATLTKTASSAQPTTAAPTNAAPAAAIEVTSPSQGAQVDSPFTLNASATSCSSQSVSSIGYTIDNTLTPVLVNGNDLVTQVAPSAGVHVLHIHAWGNDGATCSTDLSVVVNAAPPTAPSQPTAPTDPSAPSTPTSPTDPSQPSSPGSPSQPTDPGQPTAPGTPSQPTAPGTPGQPTAPGTPSQPPSPTPTPTPVGPAIPANAIGVEGIQALPAWQGDHDLNSGSGTSSGDTALTSSPSQSGAARVFNTAFIKAGGERYHVSFGADANAKHFVYDGWVYVASPSDSVANLEFDMNQVLANGLTVIFGFQCDGYSGTWDFSQNKGTPDAPSGGWVHTKAACNPRKWTTDTWHHVQVSYSRDDAGNVTYESVWFDGTEQAINQTVLSGYSLGWGKVLLTNFQVDGLGASGANTVYIDNLTVTRW